MLGQAPRLVGMRSNWHRTFYLKDCAGYGPTTLLLHCVFEGLENATRLHTTTACMISFQNARRVSAPQNVESLLDRPPRPHYWKAFHKHACGTSSDMGFHVVFPRLPAPCAPESRLDWSLWSPLKFCLRLVFLLNQLLYHMQVFLMHFCNISYDTM